MSFTNTGALSFGSSYTNFGTVGQVLCSNGPGSPPAWVTYSGTAGNPGTINGMATPTTIGAVYAETTITNSLTFGFNAGTSTNRIATCNIAIGSCSMTCNTTGFGNVILGAMANSWRLGSDCYNTAIGTCSMGYISGFTPFSAASRNTAIGAYALKTGSGCDTVSIGASSNCNGSAGCASVTIGNVYPNIGGGGCSVVISASSYSNGYGNVAIGCLTMLGSCCLGCNVAIGGFALPCISTGSGNVAIGFGAGLQLCCGNNNIAIGCYSLSAFCNTASNNIAIGEYTLSCNTAGCGNIAVGGSALGLNTSGNCNIAIGWGSMVSNCTGSFNVAIGAATMACANTATNNIALGHCAMAISNISSCVALLNNNVAIGYGAMKCLGAYGFGPNGGDQIAIGINSGFKLQGACGGNIAIGCCTLSGLSGFCTAGNIAIGNGAGLVSFGVICCASHNIGIGTCAARGVGCFQTGNTAIGTCALAANGYGTTSINDNIALGHSAMSYVGSAGAGFGLLSGNNIAMGYGALLTSSYGGWGNIALGCFAMRCSCRSSHNFVAGYNSFSANYCCGTHNIIIGHCNIPLTNFGSCAAFNIGIGYGALRGALAPMCHVAIGYMAGCVPTGACSTIFIGCNATAAASGNFIITLGDTNIACIRAQVSSITAYSDCRDKTNICSIPVGLEFVRALRPVKFEWNQRNAPNDGKRGRTEPGFIAQELDQVVERFDAEWMQLVSKDDPDRWEATIGRLLPVLTRAVQELADEGDLLQAEIDLLQSQII
jgi:hypothetical protein